jgi:hypothetical protein
MCPITSNEKHKDIIQSSRITPRRRDGAQLIVGSPGCDFLSKSFSKTFRECLSHPLLFSLALRIVGKNTYWALDAKKVDQEARNQWIITKVTKSTVLHYYNYSIVQLTHTKHKGNHLTTMFKFCESLATWILRSNDGLNKSDSVFQSKNLAMIWMKKLYMKSYIQLNLTDFCEEDFIVSNFRKQNKND